MAFPRPTDIAHRWRTAGLNFTDGALIDAIPGLVGGFPLFQPDTAKQPTFRAGALNGFGSVVNSAGKFLMTGTGVPTIPAWSVLIVVQSADTASNYFISTGSNDYAIIQGYTAGKWQNFNTPPTPFGDISTTAFQSLCCNFGRMIFDKFQVGGDTFGGDNFVGDWVDIIIWRVALTNAERDAAIVEANSIYGLAGGTPPPDTTPPTGSITSPTSGQMVSGTITATADAADNVGIGSVQFKIDGANYGAADTTLPYSIPVDTTQLSNGTHTIWAVLTDTAATPNIFTTTAVSFTVNNGTPTNQPPTVNAGTDQTITLPATANLTGTASDDNFGGSALATTWTKASGAGTVNFANANALNTTATFGAAGVYVLRLTASDGSLSPFDDVQITVNAAGVPGNTKRMLVSWNRVNHPTDSAFNPQFYRLKRATDAQMTQNVVVFNSITDLFYRDATGVFGTSYYWTVEAGNRFGYSAPFTPSVQILQNNG